MNAIISVFLLIFSGICAFSDLKSHKIKNIVILCGLGAAFSLTMAVYGIRGLPSFFIRLTVSFIIYFLLYLIHAVAAGDVKMLCIMYSLIPYDYIISFTVFAWCCAGIACIVFMIVKKNFISRFSYLFTFLKSVYYQSGNGAFIRNYDYAKDCSNTFIPFAVPVFAGYVLWLVTVLVQGNVNI